MATPHWEDQSVKRGTKIRVALWLIQQVGEGNSFTKAALRDAFPGVEQVDRRMRDLRAHGWRIDTNKEDASLTPNELRFVQAGEEVWQPGKPPGPATLSNKQRKATMAADDYMCVSCGIAGGELYPESNHERAQLGTSTRTFETADGLVVQHLTECKRCKAGTTAITEPGLEQLLSAVDSLSDQDRSTLANWITKGKRQPRNLDRLWSAYRRLPAESRAQVFDRIRSYRRMT